jgi:hypothetical protein
MLAVLIIFILLITAGAYAFRRRKQNLLSSHQEIVLPLAGSFTSLFEEPGAARLASGQEETDAAMRRNELLEGARNFDLQTLDPSQADAELYRQLLDELVTQASGNQEKLERLVTHLSKGQQLRSNAKLAEMMIADWQHSPDNRSTARMLHIVALADEAALLQQAVEMVFDGWSRGVLPRLSAKDFLALVESEYWVLAPEARRSGAGFILKNSLAALRRRVAATRRG